MKNKLRDPLMILCMLFVLVSLGLFLTRRYASPDVLTSRNPAAPLPSLQASGSEPFGPEPVPTEAGPEIEKLNINTATKEDLETLPGIGPVTAQRILDYRAQHGPFPSVAALLDIKGIGEATYRAILDYVTV